MRTRLAILVGALLLGGSAAAQSPSATVRAPVAPKWRENQPAVLTPPAARNPDAAGNAAAASFGTWYQRMERPTLLVFWNRQYSDEVTSERALTYRETEIRERPSANVSTTELTATIDSQATTGGRYASMGTLTSDELETGFVSAFLAQGARLIDRDAMIRKLSLQTDRAERIDLQLLETQALENGVDYLIEVLPARDPASPTEWAFTVRLKHLPTASLVGQVRTLAVPPAGPTHYVATDQGYVKQSIDRTTPPLIARQLATEVMSSFTRAPTVAGSAPARP